MFRVVVILFSLTAAFVALVGLYAFGRLLMDFHTWPDFMAESPPDTNGLFRDFLLVALFGIQHSVMARKSFKTLAAKWFPPALERNIYVMLSGFCLMMIGGLWTRSFPLIWHTESAIVLFILRTLTAFGFLITLLGSISIDPLGLIGIRQMLENIGLRNPIPIGFKKPGIYRLFRHPIYLGLLLIFWCSPFFYADQLVFALSFSVYTFIAVKLEEKDLEREFGADYKSYKKQVGFFGPKLF